MSGYYGKSMSNNAVEAYACGEKPMSKWTKRILLEELQKLVDRGVQTKVSIDTLRKFTLPQLRMLFLVYCVWHHTYSTFNRTDFYGIREERLDCSVDELKALLVTEGNAK